MLINLKDYKITVSVLQSSCQEASVDIHILYIPSGKKFVIFDYKYEYLTNENIIKEINNMAVIDTKVIDTKAQAERINYLQERVNRLEKENQILSKLTEEQKIINNFLFAKIKEQE